MNTLQFGLRLDRVLQGRLSIKGREELSSLHAEFTVFTADGQVQGALGIDGIAQDRPFLGKLSREGGGHAICFTFTDDELNEYVFKATLAGPLWKGPANFTNAVITRKGESEPWATLSDAVAVPAPGSFLPFRLVRKKARPVYKDHLGAFLKRKPKKFPRRKTAVAVAEAIFPAGAVIDAGGEETIARIEKSVVMKSAPVLRLLGFGFFGIEVLARMNLGKEFADASMNDRLRFMRKPARSAIQKLVYLPFQLPVFFTLLALKYFNIESNETHERLRTKKTYGVAPELDIENREERPAPDPVEPWESQIVRSETFESDEVIECDAVVIGTGAGGGPVAKELAERGYAVAILDAGKFIRREDATFGVLDGTFALGNSAIFLPRGHVVGGTTFINAGTCFRTPDHVLMKWVNMGMADFHPDRMAPYFDSVEETIHVEEADPKWVGPVGEVIKKGADALGYHSHNLRRNCPNCEGKALCSMGCPHGAKLSTNRSYIPAALKSKASLFPGFRADEIIMSGDRAIGVHAYGKGKDGKAVRLTVFAKAVVSAAGALLSPPLLQRNGLDRGNSWVGANLTFHPACGVASVVPGMEMRTHECIPQGYCVDEFRDQGLMFEGANIPLMAWAIMQRGVGKKYIEMIEKFPNMANFGYMVEDTSTGRVRPGIGDRPLVTYWMNNTDFDKMVKGMATLSRIFLAAGAERVFGMTLSNHEMRSEEDVKKFESMNWHPHDFILTAYHCLGTARVGTDAKNSALDMDHRLRGVRGLYVVDGSAIPSSVGVNPQETIMAFATRAGERIAKILEESK